MAAMIRARFVKIRVFQSLLIVGMYLKIEESKKVYYKRICKFEGKA